MGMGSSIAEERRLFDDITEHLYSEKKDHKEATQQQQEEEDHDEKEGEGKTTLDAEDEAYHKVNEIYRHWRYQQYIQSSVMVCKLVDVQDTLERAFATGLTPLIIDTSADEKVATFYSYQLDSILLPAKMFLSTQSRKSTSSSQQLQMEPLEVARRTVVNAMKNGKTVIINMNTFAVDLQKVCEVDNGEQDRDIYSFPADLLFEGGQRMKNEYWPMKLFRDEDMYPHKNFALCRDEFRVCVLSQLSLEDMHEYLFNMTLDTFGSTVNDAPLPSREHFQIVVIDHSPEEEEKQGEGKGEEEGKTEEKKQT